jgi:hypothetical protein
VSFAVEARSRRLAPADPLVLCAVAALGLLTLWVILAANGNVLLGLSPIALALVLFAMIRVPLRYSLVALGFLCLVLENPSEAFAMRLWASPLAPLGAVMLQHLNLTIPIPALIFSGLDVALLLIVGIWAVRRLAGVQVDLRGNIAAATPLRRAGIVCLATIGGVWAFGMARAGFSFGNSLWQIFRVVYLPCVFLLFCAALRGPAELRPLGVALIAAAVLRAAMAVWVRHLFPDTLIMPHATTHADSMLFSDAFLMVLVIFFERPTRRTLLLLVMVLPLLCVGMIANNRRLVWVELGISLIVIYSITPMTRLKRRLARGVVISVPVLLVYVAAGWSHHTGIFAPVGMIRSVVDSKADTSTLWRDLENFNLYSTIRSNPILGTGFGHEYIESIHLPDISQAYALYRYAPHNSILGLFAYCGFAGFAGIWFLMPLGIFFGVRSYRFAHTPRDRMASLTAIGVLVAYMVHCYGDMGLGTWTSVFTVGAALAVVGKQAVATGAWRRPSVSRV